MHLRLTLCFFASLLLCLGSAIAQESAGAAERAKAATPTPAAARASGRTVRVVAKATPAATPEEKKRGFFSRLFGRKPEPVATPTPAPAPKQRRPRKPVEGPAATPEPAAKPEETAPAKTESPKPTTETPAETPAVKPDEVAEKPAPKPPVTKATPEPKKGGKPKATPTPKPQTKEQAALEKAMASEDPEAIEKAKYDEVKVRAGGDAKVAELKNKADNAVSDEDARKELKAYNRALFQKMRTLEPSIKSRIDRMEAAVLKQLDGATE